MRKETCCHHIGYSYWLTARVLLYAPSHRQDNTYHGLCYTSRGALAGTRNSSMGPPHEGSIRRPTAPWATLYLWATSHSLAMDLTSYYPSLYLDLDFNQQNKTLLTIKYITIQQWLFGNVGVRVYVQALVGGLAGSAVWGRLAGIRSFRLLVLLLLVRNLDRNIGTRQVKPF